MLNSLDSQPDNLEPLLEHLMGGAGLQIFPNMTRRQSPITAPNIEMYA